MASINNVITTTLLAEGRLAGRDNLNVVMLLTSETGVLSTAERYRAYKSAADVATDWGSASKTNQFAKSLFATSPNAVNAGGSLVIGFHRAVSENTPATAAVLRGGATDSDLIDALQLISDGEFDIDVDGVTVGATAMDFQAVTTLTEAATVISTAIAGATVTHDGTGFVVTSDTTGATSLLSFATDPGTAGTYIGELIGLAAGTGAVLTQGSAAGVLAPETQEEAITAIRAEVAFFGSCSVDALTDPQDIASWAQANNVLFYEVFTGATSLQVSPSNDVWAIKLAGATNFRCLYRADNNRKFAVSYMARNHTVNFNAENSALTMNLKALSVPADEIDETVIKQAKRVGMDVYVAIKDVPGVLCSGANDFVDNRYNLMGYVNAIQVDSFNVLKGTATKVPQTTPGVNQLVDACEKTTRGFVRAGVWGPGEWTSPDSFGDLDTFKRQIREKGFYVLAGRLEDQSQADRQDRKSPVIQIAVKNAGAIHSADIIINFNI